MRLVDLPPGAIDWPRLPRTTLAGESGSVAQRAQMLGDVQLRVVEYGAGYVADHWCQKGHILFVVSGDLVLEYQDGGAHNLSAGMSWHVADDVLPAHRVVCERGATVFIVD